MADDVEPEIVHTQPLTMMISELEERVTMHNHLNVMQDITEEESVWSNSLNKSSNENKVLEEDAKKHPPPTIVEIRKANIILQQRLSDFYMHYDFDFFVIPCCAKIEDKHSQMSIFNINSFPFFVLSQIFLRNINFSFVS